MKQCIQCGGSFEPKNPKGKFCSDACKQKHYRNRKEVERSTKKFSAEEPVVPKKQKEIGRFVSKVIKVDKFGAVTSPPLPIKKSVNRKPFMSDAIKKKLGL